MEYLLVDATEENKEILIEYKLKSILDYAGKLSLEEINKIQEYVNIEVPKQIENYKIITSNHKIIGCLLIEDYEDGILLDEIYLEESYRHKGIGTDILKTVLEKNQIVYLWVYKLNTNAISIYQKMNFKIIKETETRYFMKWKVGDNA